jgi:sugar phosphate isomerase/epimerase
VKLGVFAKTYERPSVDESFASAARDGFSCVQFNLACSGLETLPREAVPERISVEIEHAARRHEIEIVAVSGTFNMAHPSIAIRDDGVRCLKNLVAWAAASKVSIVTLCTGSRDVADMWRAHPENNSPQAWRDMLATLTQALGAAEAAGIVLAVEPESANVVSDASSARRLLNTLRSPSLKIILDPANLVNLDAPMAIAKDWRRRSTSSWPTPSWFMPRIDEPTALCVPLEKELWNFRRFSVVCNALATTDRSWFMGFLKLRHPW